MGKVFQEIVNFIIEAILDLKFKDGNIILDKTNIDGVQKVDEIIDAALKKTGYFTALKDRKDEFKKLTEKNLELYNAKISANLEAFNKLAFKNFFEVFANDFINEEFRRPLRQIFMQHLVNEGSLKELQRAVMDLTKDGKLEGRFNQMTLDAYTIYERSQGMLLANEKGIEHFRYGGTEIDTTRDFCDARIGNIYTREEIKSWANKEWAGKFKGTNRTNIFSYLGGYNCRHTLVPVSDSLAKLEGVNKYN